MSHENNGTCNQTNEIVYNVHAFLKQLSETEDLNKDFFIQTQVITARACGISKRSIQRICFEAKLNDAPKQSTVSGIGFSSPR